MQNDNTYQDTCPVCSSVILKSFETDDQVGRCKGCGYHENDEAFSCDPNKPLDFNDDR